MTKYTNLFSKQAENYARYRPQYSQELFEALAKLAPAQDFAWDCGTGSGQAAVSFDLNPKKPST